MSLFIMDNLGMGATEVGAGPVGPGAGRELMLLGLGRLFVLALLDGILTLMRLPNSVG